MEDTSCYTTRRQVLRTAGTAAIAGVAGCIDGSLGTGVDGQSTTIRILAAGSLQNALSNGLKAAVDVPVQIETHGSATVARLINEGQRDPDIVAVADLSLFEEPLSPAWHCEFASNSLVIAYNPDTDGGQQLADAGEEHWYRPMVEGNVDVGRTDPDQDPLGYRTLFMFELASRYYDDASNLGDSILQRDQVYPETSLLSQFETGSLDAAIAYRNMALEREYAYLELPDQLDLSNPQYVEDWYSTTSYTLPSGQEIHGGLISYGATIRHMSDAAASLFDVLTTGRYLEDHGFRLGEQFPAYRGEVPQDISVRVSQSNETRSLLDRHTTDGSAVASDTTVLI
jgi:molybdate/tungstate transport system substrate-binding protein